MTSFHLGVMPLLVSEYTMLKKDTTRAEFDVRKAGNLHTAKKEAVAEDQNAACLKAVIGTV